MFGFLNVNKPSGISSHKVVLQLRKITGIKQIGHAGTLDPLASGVLPVAIGKATKLIDFLPQDKGYAVTMQFGKVSDTFDIEGKVEETGGKRVSLDEIKSVLSDFIGEIKQIPPAYSAVHYNGKRLYELARKGIVPADIPSRIINVYKNDIVFFDYDNQILKLDIECSKGTYIRTIVNDIGRELTCGAVMTELVRTKSSGFEISCSIDITDGTSSEFIEKNIVSPLSILPFEKIEIPEKDIKKVVNGNRFELQSNKQGHCFLTRNDEIIALAVFDEKFIVPEKVFV